VSHDEREARRLVQVRRELERDGYDVIVRPRGESLPPDLDEYAVDLVARRGGQTMIVEVKRYDAIAQSDELARLSSVIEQLQGYELRLEVIEAEPGQGDPATTEALVDRLASVRELAESRRLDAALLVGWAAFEGALRVRASESDIVDEGVRGAASALVRELISEDFLPAAWLSDVDRIQQVRNRVAHGFEADIQAEDVQRLIEMSSYLLESVDVTVERLIDWFLDNYEDPANGVPYESREGGYQYYLGGPYDPWEVLFAEFEDVPTFIIEAAASELVWQGGNEWVKKGQY
jgi:hypothetical protein